MDNNVTNLEFEDVSLDEFIDDSNPLDSNLNAIIYKVAGGNKTVAAGIGSLLNDELRFTRFDNAFKTLITAKNSRALYNVESGFQVTIKAVRDYLNQKSPKMPRRKAALYLYTLQHLIMTLDHWKLQSNEKNDFCPNIKMKLIYARNKNKKFGFNDDMLRRECFITDFKYPEEKSPLSSFEFLEETRLDDYLKRLRDYETTRDPSALILNNKIFPTSYEVSVKHKVIETFIKHMEKKFKIKKLTKTYFDKNENAIRKEVIDLCGLDHIPEIYNIIDGMSQCLEAEAEFNLLVDDRTM